MAEQSLMSYVLKQLQARKGTWPSIAQEMEPKAWKSYYSWLTQFACGAIPNPGVRQVQRLADRFRAENASKRKTKAA